MALILILFFAFGNPSDVSIRETIILSEGEQQHLRSIIAQNKGAGKLWRQINIEAQSLLDDVPSPRKTIDYEGLLNNDPKRIATQKSLEDMDKVAVWLSGYNGSGSKVYIQKITEYILAWAGTYIPTGNPINENKLEPMIHSFHVIREYLSPNEERLVISWLEKIAEAEMTNVHIPVNNWKAKQFKLVGTIGVVVEEPSYISYAIDEYKAYVNKALYGDGTSRDLHQRDALSYHISGLDPLLTFAIMLDQSDTHRDKNLFNYKNPDGGSLKKSVDFALPYVLGDKKYAQWTNSRVKLDRERAKAGIAKYRPGTLFKPITAINTYELASFFNRDYKKIVDRLTGSTGEYPSWLTLQIDVARTIN